MLGLEQVLSIWGQGKKQKQLSVMVKTGSQLWVWRPL